MQQPQIDDSQFLNESQEKLSRTQYQGQNKGSGTKQNLQKILPDDINDKSFTGDKIVQNLQHSFREMSPFRLSQDEQNTRSPMRRFVKPDNSIVESDLLGAGSDPLAKE